MKKISIAALVLALVALGVGGWAVWRTYDIESEFEDSGPSNGDGGGTTTTLPLVQVPSLIGKAGIAAAVQLQSLGLESEAVRQPSVDVPPGVVFSQEPESGVEVPEGTVIELTVSDGPP